jgi:hypothetical protein
MTKIKRIYTQNCVENGARVREKIGFGISSQDNKSLMPEIVQSVL